MKNCYLVERVVHNEREYLKWGKKLSDMQIEDEFETKIELYYVDKLKDLDDEIEKNAIFFTVALSAVAIILLAVLFSYINF